MIRYLELGLAVAVAATGCSSGASNVKVKHSCNFEPCGGDPAGTWTFRGGCVALQMVDMTCPKAKTKDQDFMLTGMSKLKEDGTYEREYEVQGSMNVIIPRSCLPAGGLTSCSRLASPVEETIPANIPAEASCTGDPTDRCDCAITADQMITDSGTWSTSDDTLTLQPTNGPAESFAYCVQGQTMKVRGPSETVTRLGRP